MATDQATSTSRFKVEISDDALQAWVIPTSPSVQAISPSNPVEIESLRQELRHLLSQHGVQLGADIDERIGALLAKLSKRDGSPSGAESGRFLIAQGTPPAEATDAEFVLAPLESDQAESDRDTATDHYARNTIHTYPVGAVVGHITTPTPGAYGHNVFGQEVSPGRLKPRQITLGHGLELRSPQSREVVTTQPGRIKRNGDTLLIEEVLSIPGDVCFESGNIDSIVNVHVRGDVRPKFSVISTRSIQIDGSVDEATIEAGEDLIIHGGVFGKSGPYRIRAAGEIHARILDQTRATAGADIEVRREILHSEVYTRGRIQLPTGRIIGGRVYARCGITAQVIGSDAGVRTTLIVGMPAGELLANRARNREITQLGERKERLDQLTAQLTQRMAQLSPTERERATELMAQTLEIDEDTQRLREEIEESVAEHAPPIPATIEVASMVHARTLLVFGLRQAELSSTIRGPVRFEQLDDDPEGDIVAINVSTDARVTLATSPIAPDDQTIHDLQPGDSDADEST